MSGSLPIMSMALALPDMEVQFRPNAKGRPIILRSGDTALLLTTWQHAIGQREHTVLRRPSGTTRDLWALEPMVGGLGLFAIRNVASQRYLTVSRPGRGAWTELRQDPSDEGAQWQFFLRASAQADGRAHMLVKNHMHQTYLNVKGGRFQDGQWVHMWDSCPDSDHSLWLLTATMHDLPPTKALPGIPERQTEDEMEPGTSGASGSLLD